MCCKSCLKWFLINWGFEIWLASFIFLHPDVPEMLPTVRVSLSLLPCNISSDWFSINVLWSYCPAAVALPIMLTKCSFPLGWAETACIMSERYRNKFFPWGFSGLQIYYFVKSNDVKTYSRDFLWIWTVFQPQCVLSAVFFFFLNRCNLIDFKTFKSIYLV